MAVAWPKQSKHTICHVCFGLQKIRAARVFFISAISHVTRLLRRPNHAKLAITLPKTVKTHKLPRLIWAAKSSRGANFFPPRHFARYTSFTASQPRKNGRCLAKNSQNTQFATFNLGCKKFARRELFSSQPFPTLHVFYGVPTSQKWPLPGQKQSKHTICHVCFELQKIRAARTFFIPAILHATRLLRRPSYAKLAVAWPKQSKHTICNV